MLIKTSGDALDQRRESAKDLKRTSAEKDFMARLREGKPEVMAKFRRDRGMSIPIGLGTNVSDRDRYEENWDRIFSKAK